MRVATTSASDAICRIREARSPRSSSYLRLPKFSMTALHALMKSGGGTSGIGFSCSGCSPSNAFIAFSVVPATNKFSRGVNASSRMPSRSCESLARRSFRIKRISLLETILSFSSAARILSRFINSAGPVAPASLACVSLASSSKRKDSSIFPSRASFTMAPSILIGSPIAKTDFKSSVAAPIRLLCSPARASRRTAESASPVDARSVNTFTNCASNLS
mmetsp:Transcript_118521/g.177130  ORF Transcript_118521/g.177130 Transcript_118521/m.177130 type:complete len:219 (+) Transcript_118521:221-877(+)